ncbi:hypothetical protein Vafri_11885, partial [Volvox africanus]
GLQLVLSLGPTPAAALLVPRRLGGLPRGQAQALDALEILDGPGSAGLSARLEFGALKMAAEGAAAAAAVTTSTPVTPPLSPVGTSGPVSQTAFLHALGIKTRLKWLASPGSNPAEAVALVAGYVRLLDGSEECGMEVSYQVIAIHQAGLRELGGFLRVRDTKCGI